MMQFEGREAVLAVSQVITERKHAEEALQRSEARQHELLEAIPCSLVISDAETSSPLYVNEYAYNTYGLELGKVRIIDTWNMVKGGSQPPIGTPTIGMSWSGASSATVRSTTSRQSSIRLTAHPNGFWSVLV